MHGKLKGAIELVLKKNQILKALREATEKKPVTVDEPARPDWFGFVSLLDQMVGFFASTESYEASATEATAEMERTGGLPKRGVALRLAWSELDFHIGEAKVFQLRPDL